MKSNRGYRSPGRPNIAKSLRKNACSILLESRAFFSDRQLSTLLGLPIEEVADIRTAIEQRKNRKHGD